jgi:hypothetical protein
VEDYIIKYNRENADSTKSIEVYDNYHSLCNDKIDNYLPDKYLNKLKKYILLLI